MKQVLFLGAIYALIFHQSSKNDKMQTAIELKKKKDIISTQINDQPVNHNKYNAEKFPGNSPFLGSTQHQSEKYFSFIVNK